jgi:hypothetical protein
MTESNYDLTQPEQPHAPAALPNRERPTVAREGLRAAVNGFCP